MGRIGHCSGFALLFITYLQTFMPGNVPIGCILPPVMTLTIGMGTGCTERTGG